MYVIYDVCLVLPFLYIHAPHTQLAIVHSLFIFRELRHACFVDVYATTVTSWIQSGNGQMVASAMGLR